MKTIMLISVCFIFCISNFKCVYSQPYRYPVLPGDELWKKQMSYAERVKLCNIPDDILKSISTKDLLLSIFNFPFSHILNLSGNFLDYFDYLRKIYNGIDEFVNREDAAEVLFTRYIHPDSYNSLGQEVFLENFLSLSQIQSALDDSQKKILMDSCMLRLQRRVDSKSFMAFTSMATASRLMLRLLSHLDNTKFNNIVNDNKDILIFYETSAYPSRQTVNKIVFELVRNNEK